MSEMLDTLWKVSALIFAAGAVWSELKAVRKDLDRLEKKVELHNTFDKRLTRLEAKVEINHE